MSKNEKWECDSCGKSIIRGTYYTMEAPNRSDLRFCCKCAAKYRKIVYELMKELTQEEQTDE